MMHQQAANGISQWPGGNIVLQFLEALQCFATQGLYFPRWLLCCRSH